MTKICFSRIETWVMNSLTSWVVLCCTDSFRDFLSAFVHLKPEKLDASPSSISNLIDMEEALQLSSIQLTWWIVSVEFHEIKWIHWHFSKAVGYSFCDINCIFTYLTQATCWEMILLRTNSGCHFINSYFSRNEFFFNKLICKPIATHDAVGIRHLQEHV